MTQLIEDFKITSCNFSDNKSRVESDTRDLRFLARNTTGQRFEFTIRSIELDEKAIKRVMAFVNGVKRRNDTIEVFIPGFSESEAGAIGVDGAYIAGDFEITLSNVAGVAVGDFLSFAGHSKAYQVEEIIGNVVTITPNLMRPVANAELANFGAVEFTMRPRGRMQRFSVSDGVNNANLELDLVEVWA